VEGGGEREGVVDVRRVGGVAGEVW